MIPEDLTPVVCKMKARDWKLMVTALRELAQVKHDKLANTNASDREWDEVVGLRRTADDLEVEFLQELIWK